MVAAPMRYYRLAGLILLSSVFNSGPVHAGGWHEVPGPLAVAARSIGKTTAGCLAGGVALSAQGTGYKVMHLERRRFYGHPDLVDAIQAVARVTAQQRWGELHIGDLSQPRGGPLPFGHQSHQSGLDADIWFSLDRDLLQGADAWRSNIMPPSLLTSDQRRLNHFFWDENHARVLKEASRNSRVDRIFVNAHIKRELCLSVRGDRSWLRKIRPWHRHDDHFHLRLSCPAGSPECESQDPVPAGDGCDQTLSWWLSLPPLPALPLKPQPHTGPLPVLPSSCRAVLKGR